MKRTIAFLGALWTFHLLTCLGLGSLRAADDLVISEFMASNISALADDDGDFSDWIEVYNAGTTTVNLGNWCLTDSAVDLTKWRFPAVSLASDKFLIVYASNKDRRSASAPLHTNFRLAREGGYLGLVKPDGVTVAHEYSPYPPQFDDFSYGLKQDSTQAQLVASGANAMTLIPADASVDATWTGLGFSDASWIAGKTGVGYDRNPDYLGLIQTNVSAQMDNVNTTAYVRIPFTATNPGQFTGLTLKVMYDDGFIAYLNGAQIASRNAPSPPAWNSVATAQHDDTAAVVFEEFTATSFLGTLRNGSNVLAIQGLNSGLTSSDFLVVPELVAFATGALDKGAEEFFDKATPGSGNLAGYPGVTEAPQFSRASGVITAAFQLTLSSSTPGATIRYTTDRSEPTASSTLYSGPFSVGATTMVRAKAFAGPSAPSATATSTYVMLAANARSFTSNLPVMVIETFGQGINDSFWTTSFAAVMEPGANGRTSMTSTPTFSGRGGIKARGSSSLGFPKKNFAFEVRDEHDSDLDVSILGMPEQSDWILLGPYTDKTLMRDYLAYLWSNRMGRYAVRTKFIEVFLNTGGGNVDSADLAGVYVFEEKIKRDGDRVDLKKLTASDNTAPEVTGGYILKKDRLDPGDSGMSTSRGHVLGFVYPKEQNITAAQRAYIQGYMNEFESALYGASFKDPVNGFRKYIDVDSFIDHHIVVELTKNIDGFRLSTFMFKDRDGKLNMGPVWDYNLCLGNANYLNGWIASDFYYPQLSEGDYPWYGRLFQDGEFAQRYKDRWTQFRRVQLSTSLLLNDITDAAVLLDEAQARNYQIWPILGQYVWPNWYIGATYEDEINFMTSWLQDRLVWWDGLYAPPPSLNRYGGSISAGFQLTMTAPSGTIYYTLDGSDPRASGGGNAAGALTYSAPVTINANARVVARAKTTAKGWSGPVDVTFVVKTPSIVVTEIMYHPENPLLGDQYNADDFEFIELENVGSQPIDLAGIHFTKGINFTFPVDAGSLAPDEMVVLVKNRAAFEIVYGTEGIRIGGEYSGNLSNAGEELALEGPLNEPILDFTYDDAWVPETDGLKHSLVIVDASSPLSTWGDAASWKMSAYEGGSPGSEDGFTPQGGRQLPGDANQDGVVDLSDALSLLLRLFGGLSKPLPCDGASVTDGGNRAVFDVNGDASVDVSDAVHILSFLFRGGAAPSRGTACTRVDGCPTACP